MVKCMPDFFIVVLKKRNIISKIKRSKVTDYAALTPNLSFCQKYTSNNTAGVTFLEKAV